MLFLYVCISLGISLVFLQVSLSKFVQFSLLPVTNRRRVSRFVLTTPTKYSKPTNKFSCWHYMIFTCLKFTVLCWKKMTGSLRNISKFQFRHEWLLLWTEMLSGPSKKKCLKKLHDSYFSLKILSPLIYKKQLGFSPPDVLRILFVLMKTVLLGVSSDIKGLYPVQKNVFFC